MNYSEIIVGDRVLVQSGAETKEIAVIKDVNGNTGLALVRLSDGQMREMHPQFIIKSFGQL